MDKKEDRYGIWVDWDRLIKEHPEKVPSIYRVIFDRMYPNHEEIVENKEKRNASD